MSNYQSENFVMHHLICMSNFDLEIFIGHILKIPANWSPLLFNTLDLLAIGGHYAANRYLGLRTFITSKCKTSVV